MERTLRGIFQTHFEAYARAHKLPAYVHRAAYWIAHCRTAELGGHVRRCPEGHVERAFYNSCHQRGCPQCQGLATERWLERQRARLLKCAHHHLIFTIAHELNALWCWNRVVMAKLLFGAVREVLYELLGDARYLGATPAFISALHTWGRSASLHPHLHVLAADGGLDKNGAWVKPRRSHFLPARVVMWLFRGKFLDALRQALERGELRVPADSSRERVRSMLNRLGRKKWNVHIRARYAHGEGVAAYLARYLKGGPLKNTQLLDVSEDRVAFRYRPHRDEDDAGQDDAVMSLTPEAFLARYLAHIPAPRLQTVRGYDPFHEYLVQGWLRAPTPILGSPGRVPHQYRVAHRSSLSIRVWPFAVPLLARGCWLIWPLLTSVRSRHALLRSALRHRAPFAASFARVDRQPLHAPGPCSTSGPVWLLTLHRRGAAAPHRSPRISA